MITGKDMAPWLALVVTACGNEGEATKVDGDTLYSKPILDGNSFACATCHALSEPAADGLRRPGHPIGGAPQRPHFKNGQLTEFRAAVNSCLTEWMNAEPWSADDERLSALIETLNRHGGDDGTDSIDFEVLPPPAELSGGDAERGQAVFNQTCRVCHGQDGVGTVRAPAVAGLGLDAELVATRVRTSGRRDSAVYQDLTGGIMPFWSADRLSDTELLDLVAWLEQGEAPVGAGGASGNPSSSGASSTSGARQCDVTHERVGQVAILDTFFHDVAGTATIVDDCTIVIDDFTYDGGGIDVRIYGGLMGDYDGGFALTEDLLKTGGYAGESLIATLPEGRTLDELDGVSVWCVAVGADFGSGSFAPN